MQKRKVFSILAIVMVAALSLAFMFLGMNLGSNLNQLKEVEVREYQGELLSSITNFRENSIKGPQYIDMATYRLTITGLVKQTRVYTYREVLGNFTHHRKVVTLDCVEGWSVKILWEGVLLKDIISKAEVTSSAKVIIFRAYDGYSTSFPLNYVIDNDIIMATKMIGVTLPPERGFPFQLVAESKWGYKWIKWVTQIELSDDANHRGYWESRGYSNDGSLDNALP